MNIKSRIKRIETNVARNFDDWIKGLSDKELERIVGENVGSGDFARWLTTLTDAELETIRYNKPGADTLKGKFNEHQKQIEETSKPSNRKRF